MERYIIMESKEFNDNHCIAYTVQWHRGDIIEFVETPDIFTAYTIFLSLSKLKNIADITLKSRKEFGETESYE